MEQRHQLAVTSWIDGLPAPLAGWLTLSATTGLNSDGSATLAFREATEYLGDLLTDRLAITITDTPSDQQWWSGRVQSRGIKVDNDTGAITVPFRHDLGVLREVACLPNPTRPISDQQAEFWTATGPAETVIKQLLTAQLARYSEPVAIVPSRGRGPTVTLKGRLEPLWDLVMPIANTNSLRIDAYRVGGRLTLDVTDTTADVLVMPLSVETPMVRALSWETPRPEATVVYVAGYGTGSARRMAVVESGPAIAAWGRIEKTLEFPSPTIATTGDDMYLWGLQQLATMLPKQAIDVKLADTEALTYGREIVLGTQVTVEHAGAQVTDRVSAAAITDTPDQGVVVELTVGAQDARTDPDTILAGHISRLEAAMFHTLN